MLGLLYLSAAFDTVDHDILIQRLQTIFGIRSGLLALLISFEPHRTHTDSRVRGLEIYYIRCHLGVPLGSSIGPLLSVLYRSRNSR